MARTSLGAFALAVLLYPSVLGGFVQSDIELAMREMSDGKFAEAATQLDRATKNRPDDAELWNLLGICRTELHQLEGAKQAFAKGLSLAPNAPSLHENAGLLYLRQGDYARAKRELSRAVSLGSAKPGTQLSLASAELRTGDGQQARERLRLLQPELDQSFEYWLERGRAELPVDPPAAESCFVRGTELKPSDPIAWNEAARAAESQGLDEKALSYLIRARTLNPDDLGTLQHFGELCIRRDLGPDAMAALEHAHELAPRNSSILFLLARANISVQNWQRAHSLFGDFIRRQPSYAPAHYAVAWVDLQLNQRQEAERELDTALRLNPKYADARYERGRLKLDDGDLAGAQTDLSAALDADPAHSKAHIAMGDLLLRQNAPDRAREQFEAAVRAAPQSSSAHYKLASALARLHDTDGAGRERSLAAHLAEEEKKSSKTQLRLVLPGENP